MIQKVSSFLKKDTVLTIALALAVLSMFIIPPSAGYLGYLDLHTLILLFGLMTATTGLQNIGFFRQLGELLLLRIHSLRQLEQLLILLCFFSSMLITNDVSLITFVPFALELLRMVNRKDRIVPVVVCQTLAANLGSMTTPVGNPQNLYLYSHFELSLDTFIRSIGPFSLLSLVLLLLITMFTPRETISLDTAGRDTTSDETFPKRCLFCCLGMFSPVPLHCSRSSAASNPVYLHSGDWLSGRPEDLLSGRLLSHPDFYRILHLHRESETHSCGKLPAFQYDHGTRSDSLRSGQPDNQQRSGRHPVVRIYRKRSSPSDRN